MLSKDKVVDMLIFLNLANNGLQYEELRKLSLMSIRQIDLCLLAFSPFIISLEGYMKLRDKSFIEYSDMMSQDTELEFYYRRIGEVLSDSPMNVRRLEEQMLAFYKGKEYFQLKQLISSIENLLVCFQPNLKRDLVYAWKALISQRYDPVIEYNKSLEAFEMHFQPSHTDLFIIILQLSRLFKDLADFENSDIPEFRHPNLVNIIVTKTAKGCYAETSHQPLKKQEELDSGVSTFLRLQNDDDNFFIKNDMKLNASDYTIIEDEELDAEENGLNQRGQVINFLDEIGLLKEAKSIGLFEEGFSSKDILASYEKANVDIQAGFDKYIEEFKRNIEARLHEREIVLEVDNQQPLFLYKEDGTEESSNYFRDMLEDRKGKQKADNTELMFPKLGNNGNLAIPPSKHNAFYYYKRWLWLVFPWACMSVDADMVYSDMISLCYAGEGKSLRIKDDEELCRRAQMITVEAKYSKMMIIEGKKNTISIGSVTTLRSKKIGKLTDRLRSQVGSTKRDNLDNMSTGIEGQTTLQNQFNNDSIEDYTAVERQSQTQFYITQASFRNIKPSTQNANSMLNGIKSRTKSSFYSASDLKRNTFHLTEHKLNIADQFQSIVYDQKIKTQLVSKAKKLEFNGMLQSIRGTFQEKADNELVLMVKKRNALLDSLNVIACEM